MQKRRFLQRHVLFVVKKKAFEDWLDDINTVIRQTDELESYDYKGSSIPRISASMRYSVSIFSASLNTKL